MTSISSEFKEIVEALQEDNQELREIIAEVLRQTDVPTTAKFLDDMKGLGYMNAFRGGLSFSIGDIRIPQYSYKISCLY